MCGIAGFYSRGAQGNKVQAPEETIRKMAGSMGHRGPDGEGTWLDPDAGLAFGHRRLAIIDLSPAGRQPMISSCNRYVMILNGEIYNFNELRNDLEKEGRCFRGHSDAEAALEAMAAWGFKQALLRFIGMFALAVWDREERVLKLARDRLGEKPLYYGLVKGVFVFASELKALRQFPLFAPTVDRNSLALFLRHNYIPAPYTIYEGVYKLGAGQVLSVDGGCYTDLPRPEPYWSAKEIVERGLSQPAPDNEQAAVQQMHELLKDAVRIRMRSDVPLGVFLSGGIDSTLVTALMQTQSSRPVRSFTIGFREEQFNEAKYASRIAGHLGTAHTELFATPQDALDVIPKLPDIYDEPFADSSAIPTYLVSRLTRQHVTVALSGDGGDELFGGYNRYLWCHTLGRWVRRIPRPARRTMQAALKTLPAAAWDGMRVLRVQSLADKVQKISEILPLENTPELYGALISQWKRPCEIAVGSREPLTAVTDPACRLEETDGIEWMMYTDLRSYLPDDILVKMDRASMASSLEGRAVYLDHRVVESAWRMPLSLKIRGKTTKWTLRKILSSYVPTRLVERPKMGFGIPLHQWLRGPLKAWAQELLDEKRLKREGFFEPSQITVRWREHLSGRRNWHYSLWVILMFQAWRERWM